MLMCQRRCYVIEMPPNTLGEALFYSASPVQFESPLRRACERLRRPGSPVTLTATHNISALISLLAITRRQVRNPPLGLVERTTRRSAHTSATQLDHGHKRNESGERVVSRFCVCHPTA